MCIVICSIDEFASATSFDTFYSQLKFIHTLSFAHFVNTLPLFVHFFLVQVDKKWTRLKSLSNGTHKKRERETFSFQNMRMSLCCQLKWTMMKSFSRKIKEFLHFVYCWFTVQHSIRVKRKTTGIASNFIWISHHDSQYRFALRL